MPTHQTSGEAEEWPRQLWAKDTHYLIHKVAKAWLDDSGKPRFELLHEDGRVYSSPIFQAARDERPQAQDRLANNGMQSLDEVRYIVAYHNGAAPMGIIGSLFPNLETLDARYANDERKRAP